MASHAVCTKETAENVVTHTPLSSPCSDHLPAVHREPLLPALQNGRVVLCPLSGWPQRLRVSGSRGSCSESETTPPFSSLSQGSPSAPRAREAVTPGAWKAQSLTGLLPWTPSCSLGIGLVPQPQPTHWLPFTRAQALLLLGTLNLETYRTAP